MSKISAWMRTRSQDMAELLVEINVDQFIKGNISGYGMRSRVIELIETLKASLYPTLYASDFNDSAYLGAQVTGSLNTAAMMLHSIIKDVLMNKCRINGDHEHTESCHECETEADDVTIAFLRSLPDIRRTLATDIQAAYEGDPAAIYTEEILLGYPSIEAVSIYRMAHKLFELGVPIIPRVMTEYAHQQTGIDIHPGATIGRHFFIDHGTGVVIGETCVIGDNVKLYQGVTLGAKSFEMDDAGMPVKGVKRHPNIENNVVIYSGATILGGDTTVGEGSIIGGNVWLVHSVPPHTRVYNSTPNPNISMEDP